MEIEKTTKELYNSDKKSTFRKGPRFRLEAPLGRHTPAAGSLGREGACLGGHRDVHECGGAAQYCQQPQLHLLQEQDRLADAASRGADRDRRGRGPGPQVRIPRARRIYFQEVDGDRPQGQAQDDNRPPERHGEVRQADLRDEGARAQDGVQYYRGTQSAGTQHLPQTQRAQVQGQVQHREHCRPQGKTRARGAAPRAHRPSHQAQLQRDVLGGHFEGQGRQRLLEQDAVRVAKRLKQVHKSLALESAHFLFQISREPFSLPRLMWLMERYLRIQRLSSLQSKYFFPLNSANFMCFSEYIIIWGRLTTSIFNCRRVSLWHRPSTQKNQCRSLNSLCSREKSCSSRLCCWEVGFENNKTQQRSTHCFYSVSEDLTSDSTVLLSRWSRFFRGFLPACWRKDLNSSNYLIQLTLPTLNPPCFSEFSGQKYMKSPLLMLYLRAVSSFRYFALQNLTILRSSRSRSAYITQKSSRAEAGWNTTGSLFSYVVWTTQLPNQFSLDIIEQDSGGLQAKVRLSHSQLFYRGCTSSRSLSTSTRAGVGTPRKEVHLQSQWPQMKVEPQILSWAQRRRSSLVVLQASRRMSLSSCCAILTMSSLLSKVTFFMWIEVSITKQRYRVTLEQGLRKSQRARKFSFESSSSRPRNSTAQNRVVFQLYFSTTSPGRANFPKRCRTAGRSVMATSILPVNSAAIFLKLMLSSNTSVKNTALSRVDFCRNWRRSSSLSRMSSTLGRAINTLSTTQREFTSPEKGSWEGTRLKASSLKTTVSSSGFRIFRLVWSFLPLLRGLGSQQNTLMEEFVLCSSTQSTTMTMQPQGSCSMAPSMMLIDLLQLVLLLSQCSSIRIGRFACSAMQNSSSRQLLAYMKSLLLRRRQNDLASKASSSITRVQQDHRLVYLKYARTEDSHLQMASHYSPASPWRPLWTNIIRKPWGTPLARLSGSPTHSRSAPSLRTVFVRQSQQPWYNLA